MSEGSSPETRQRWTSNERGCQFARVPRAGLPKQPSFRFGLTFRQSRLQTADGREHQRKAKEIHSAGKDVRDKISGNLPAP